MGLPPFQSFFDAHQVDVYRFLSVAVGAQEADDCFQETFIAALRGYRRLRPDSNLKGWVLTIAQRKAIDHHRARVRRPQPTNAAATEGARLGDVEFGGFGDVWDSVRRLPAKQMTAVVLRYVNDLAYRDIARAMATSEAAARQNVRQALLALRQEMRNETA